MRRSLPAALDASRAAPGRVEAAAARLGGALPGATVDPSPHPLVRGAGRGLDAVIRCIARAITGVRAIGSLGPVSEAPRVYFANHASHADIVLIRATLPKPARRATRPVAGSDYWEVTPLRRFLGRHVFRVLTIDRNSAWMATASLNRMIDALDRGQSLVLFPEGTRNTGAAPLLPFKCGLYYLGQSRPRVELVPVWIDNAGRAMPKGRWLPVPVLCSVCYGAPLRVEAGEDKEGFMRRAAAAVEALQPRSHEAA